MDVNDLEDKSHAVAVQINTNFADAEVTKKEYFDALAQILEGVKPPEGAENSHMELLRNLKKLHQQFTEQGK